MFRDWIRPFLLFALLVGGWAAGCASPDDPAPPADSVQSPIAAPVVLPTLYPTATATVVDAPSPLATLRPTAIPDTPVPLGQLRVSFRYQIPALELDRRLEGTVGGQATLIDETAGRTVTRHNQEFALLEMERAFQTLELAPLPAGCPRCVYFEYDLPLEGRSAAGWLQDVQILASVEHFTTVHLGAHFPPQTVAGLRRSATAYQVAHSLALTEDGRLWRWLAIEGEVAEPLLLPDEGAVVRDLLPAISAAALDSDYLAECEGAPVETLLLRRDDGMEQSRLICPELALPSTLVPLYAALDDFLAEKVADTALDRPEPPLALSALLLYRRADGAQLRLDSDGAAAIVDASGAVYTATIDAGQSISLTLELVAAGSLSPDPDALFSDRANILIVRDPAGVWSLGWDDALPTPLIALVAELDSLFVALLDDGLDG